jgi:DNA-binding transcriptional regulator YdaS (Cro superfamily)
MHYALAEVTHFAYHSMNLRTFLDGLPRGGITEFARKVGISSVYMSQLAAHQDGREPSAELCVVIERESNKEVTRKDLRPTDWHLIWPELAEKERRKNSDKASAAPQAAAAPRDRDHREPRQDAHQDKPSRRKD